jgi:hypothetical protein
MFFESIFRCIMSIFKRRKEKGRNDWRGQYTPDWVFFDYPPTEEDRTRVSVEIRKNESGGTSDRRSGAGAEVEKNPKDS